MINFYCLLILNNLMIFFINESDLYSLLLPSISDKTKDFKKWITFDLLSTIRKHGSYNMKKTYDHKPFYDNHELINYSNKNVIYNGYIGIYNNEHIFKFGKMNNIYEMDYGKHKYKYDKFDIVYVVECNNKDVVEKRFKEELIVKNIYRSFNINGRNDKELFTITNEITIDKIKNILNLLVNKFKINKDYVIAEYEYQLERERTAQKLIDLKMMELTELNKRN